MEGGENGILEGKSKSSRRKWQTRRRRRNKGKHIEKRSRGRVSREGGENI